MQLAKCLVAIAASCFLLAMASPASATLLDGKTINFQYYYPDLSSPFSDPNNGNKVVGPGVEITNLVSDPNVDLADTNILVDFTTDDTFGAAAFNGFVISDIFGAINPFTSVTINPVTNVAGFSALDVTFDANNIRVNLAGLADIHATSVISLDIGGGATSAIPEPGTLALLSSGLIALAFRRRRSKP